jgi:YHS domain-containing protein
MSSKVIDPVCGMQVDPAKSAGSFEYKGTTYHFCGIRCLEKFKNDPESFLSRAAVKPAAAMGSVLSLGAANATAKVFPRTRKSR